VPQPSKSAALSRRLARRWGLAATAVTAIVVYGAGAALRFDLASSTVSFVMFGFLFGGAAAFLGGEVARYRRCPRCGHQQQARPGSCPECCYDVRGRPLYVCSERHPPSYEPGLCDCGRRLQEWVPPDVAGHVKRSLWIGAAIFTALVLGGLLLGR
jgi:hypothetical protein